MRHRGRPGTARQIEIAAGQPPGHFPRKRSPAAGHAIECRIYAEDPENGFFPSPGTVGVYQAPSGPGIRNDTGIYAGAVVPVEYDPILSKLTVHAETRDQAIARMIHALAGYLVTGVRVPVDFLADVLDCRAFRKGEVFTDFIDTHFSEWAPKAEDELAACLAFIADDLCPGTVAAAGEGEPGFDTPFKTLGGLRF